jgi:hypothetical protein
VGPLGGHDHFFWHIGNEELPEKHQLGSLCACPTASNISELGERILVKFGIGMISSTAATLWIVDTKKYMLLSLNACQNEKCFGHIAEKVKTYTHFMLTIVHRRYNGPGYHEQSAMVNF